MKKEYYNEKIANHIYKKLSFTSIDQVYWPIITDIMLRRQFEYGLSSKLIDRDINNFIKNVQHIGAGTLEPKETGEFIATFKQIKINDKMFDREDVDFEKIYQNLAHEFIHAISIERKRNGVEADRAFPFSGFSTKIAVTEIFTECQSDDLVYNKKYKDNEISKTRTSGYSRITPYIDLIVATFGISKKELLGAAVNGEECLNKLLNKKINMRQAYSNKNIIFEGITFNLELLYSAMMKTNSQFDKKNIEEVNRNIYLWAEKGINERISNINTNVFSAFKEKFEQIKLDQRVIQQSIEDFDNQWHGMTYIKLKTIDEILRNQDIVNKSGLVQAVQRMQATKEIMQFNIENNISIDLIKEPTISQETIKKHNMEYSSNGIEWDNTPIVEYLKEYKEEIVKPILIHSQNPQAKFQELKHKIRNLIAKFHKKDKTKLLTEGSIDLKSKEVPWDLSNWGINKKQFMEEQAKNREENSKKIEENKPDEQTIPQEY